MAAALELVVEAPIQATTAWEVRRIRAEMLRTLPDLPQALCDTPDVDPDLWHPARANRRQELEAMKICMHCSELLSCLGYAMRAHPISGVWGATTEAQRRVMMLAVEKRRTYRE